MTLYSVSALEEQRRLHADPRGYGGRGRKWRDLVVEMGTTYQCRSLLDYGCGQGTLCAAITSGAHPFTDIREYDPAILGKDAPPSPAELVVCTDVLEHVEPDYIWSVTEHLAAMTIRACFLVVSLVETSKRLSDGRQAHLLLRSVEWWVVQCAAHGLFVARDFAIKPEKQWVALLTRRHA
jgi:2-polyprenyl-3-methyl-5-hydroxy-6-metoxy-1,4-benzoquinol methylase